MKIATVFLSRRKLRDSELEKIRGNPASPNAGDRYKRIRKREYGPRADRLYLSKLRPYHVHTRLPYIVESTDLGRIVSTPYVAIEC